MARALTLAELRDLLGAHALDAVDADEREQVEAWLARDPDARRDADELRETASMLAQADVELPEDLWSRIEERLGEAAESAVDAPPPLRLGNVVDLDARRATTGSARPRRPRLVAAAAAIALVVAVAVGVFAGARLSDQDDRIDEIAAGMQRGAMEQAAAIARMTDGSRTAELVASDGTMMAEIVVTADGRGFVSPSELPTLPAGRTYQLWAMSDDWPETPAVSVGVLGRDPSVFAFQADGGVAGFAITEERAPGVERTRQAEKFEGWLA